MHNDIQLSSVTYYERCHNMLTINDKISLAYVSVPLGFIPRNGSTATWKHFNLHREFDFSDERMVDSMGLALPKNIGSK